MTEPMCRSKLTAIVLLCCALAALPGMTWQAQTASRPDLIGVFRTTEATFYLRLANESGQADFTIPFGSPGDLPVTGDWDGDGIDNVGVYRVLDNIFFLTNINQRDAPTTYRIKLGEPGDLPLMGDWDGDGKDGIGIFRPPDGLFVLIDNLNAPAEQRVIFNMAFGSDGDTPVAGDWDGDGKDSPGLYRPYESIFYLTNQVCDQCVVSEPDFILRFGEVGDIAFAGDWDGDGKDGIGVFRRASDAGRLMMRNELTIGEAELDIFFGGENDLPVAGKWTAPVVP